MFFAFLKELNPLSTFHQNDIQSPSVYLAMSSALAPAPARATAMARAMSAAAAGSAAIALAKFSFRAAAISSAEAPEAAWGEERNIKRFSN